MGRSPHLADLERCRGACENLVHFRALGMRIIHLAHGKGALSVDYQEMLIGDTRTGVIHGGVITTLLDTLGWLVALASVPDGTPLATLDLRIDYLRPATPGQTIRASAECHTVTTHVAFARGIAYHETATDPIVHYTGAYMVGGPGYSTKGAEMAAPS